MKKIFMFATLGLLLIGSTKNVSALSFNESKSGKEIINSKNVTFSEKKYFDLLDAGYTFSEVDNMDEATYKNINLNNKNVAVSKKYYKTTTTTSFGETTSNTEEVSKNEFDNAKTQTAVAITAQGQVETAYKLLTATISDITATNQKRYKAYLYWKSIPSKRSYDIIGVGCQPSYVTIGSNVNFTHYYTTGGVTHVVYNYIPKETSTGAGAVFQLQSGTLSNMAQELYYNVSKLNSGTLTSLSMSGDYAHATSTVTSSQAQDYTINHVGGLGLGGSIISKYDSMSAAIANWGGSW